MATSKGIVGSFLEVFNTDMPLRNFTMRLYARLLFQFKPELDEIQIAQESSAIPLAQQAVLMEALKKHSRALKRIVSANVVSQGAKVYDPEFRLFETFRLELSNFNPPETSLKAEYTRNLAHPFLLLRLQTERLANRIPPALKQPSPENERSPQNISNLIQNFLLVRHLVCKVLLKQS